MKSQCFLQLITIAAHFASLHLVLLTRFAHRNHNWTSKAAPILQMINRSSAMRCGSHGIFTIIKQNNQVLYPLTAYHHCQTVVSWIECGDWA
jgi:hypothetical protein